MEEIETLWKVKPTGLIAVTGVVGTGIPKLGEGLQQFQENHQRLCPVPGTVRTLQKPIKAAVRVDGLNLKGNKVGRVLQYT